MVARLAVRALRRLWRWLASTPADPNVVRLHVRAPVGGDGVVPLKPPVHTVQRPPRRLIEDHADFGERAPVDFERLPP